MQRMNFEVFGKVQGVNFRYYTRKQAVTWGLVGWCRNTSSGTVKGIAEGSQENIQKMRLWLSQVGSPHSHIEDCNVEIVRVGRKSSRID